MSGNKIGELLGDLVDDLKNVSFSIGDIVSEISDIDGAIIFPESFDEDAPNNQPYMTAGEFKELLNRASNDLRSLGAELRDIAESLQSLSVEILATTRTLGRVFEVFSQRGDENNYECISILG